MYQRRNLSKSHAPSRRLTAVVVHSLLGLLYPIVRVALICRPLGSLLRSFRRRSVSEIEEDVLVRYDSGLSAWYPLLGEFEVCLDRAWMIADGINRLT